MKIAVLGAGAWGTSVAVQLARRHQVYLWVRNAADAQAMQSKRENAHYLPNVRLPDALEVRAGIAATQDVADCDLVLIACPVAGFRQQLVLLRGARQPVVWLCKGFEKVQDDALFGLLPHEIVQQIAPELLSGVLSGPSFAQEVANNQPTALVIASPHEQVRQTVVQAMHSESLRVYTSADWVGVEVGGAVKNVMAIATGVLDGLSQIDNAPTSVPLPGLNARAALLTRGLAEMTRLGIALGADKETFMGLSGMGDLVLTATGHLSRNRRVGLLLAQGMTAQQAVDSLGHVAEGVYSARTVLLRSQGLKVEMPVTRCVVDLLDGTVDVWQATRALMTRNFRSESDWRY